MGTVQSSDDAAAGGCPGPAHQPSADVTGSSDVIVERAFRAYLEHLIGAAQGISSDRFNLVKSLLNPGIVVFDNRVLGFHFTLQEQAADDTNQSLAVELFAGRVMGGRVMTPDHYLATPRFLRLSGKHEDNQVSWCYRHLADNGHGQQESLLNPETLAQKCVGLLVQAPTFPPDARMVARFFTT